MFAWTLSLLLHDPQLYPSVCFPSSPHCMSTLALTTGLSQAVTVGMGNPWHCHALINLHVMFIRMLTPESTIRLSHTSLLARSVSNKSSTSGLMRQASQSQHVIFQRDLWTPMSYCNLLFATVMCILYLLTPHHPYHQFMQTHEYTVHLSSSRSLIKKMLSCIFLK